MKSHFSSWENILIRDATSRCRRTAHVLAARCGLTPRKSANASPVGHKLWPTVELWVVDEFFDPLAGSPPMTLTRPASLFSGREQTQQGGTSAPFQTLT